jgi:hypothetical protein
MKITIVTDSNGNLVGAVMGHTLTSKYGDVEAQVSFPKGHKLHKAEVEDDMAQITDPTVFNSRLRKHLPKDYGTKPLWDFIVGRSDRCRQEVLPCN